MPDNRPRDDDEEFGFPGGWKGLYLFVLVYGALQIVLLYIFTIIYNRP